MIRAAIYTRISEDRDGLASGVGRQEDDCRKLCSDRGWLVASVYIDNDQSAYSGKPRPAYIAMMTALSAGDLDAIVAYNADRLHRSPTELETFIDAIEARHATVATCTGGDYDLSTADGRLTARMLGSVARHQSERAAERIRRKMIQQAEDGRPHGGRRPYGFQSDQITHDEREASVIREVTAALIDGASLRGICNDLNARGVYGASGRPWQAVTMRWMLLSPRLIGKREHRVTGLYDAVWPAIITELQQIQLRAILTRRGARVGAPGMYLLSGLLRCGVCDSRMQHRPKFKRNKAIYQCPTPPRGHSCVSITASMAEEFITAAIIDHEPEFVELGDETADDDGGDLAATIAADNRMITDLGIAYANQLIPLAALQSATSVIEARIRDGERTLAARTPGRASQSRIPPKGRVRDNDGRILTDDELRAMAMAGATYEDLWDDFDIDERRNIIAALVDHIDVHRSTLHAFDPARLYIVWR